MLVHVIGWHKVKRLSLRAGINVTTICSLGLILLASGVMPHVTSALQATPVPANEDVTCNVAPRSVADILALLKPQSGDGVPGLSISPLPTGEPADAATTTAMAAALQEVEACFNAGDLLRFYSLFSDDWLRQLLSTDEVVAEVTALATATPSPIPEGYRAVFLGPWHIQVLPDGRVLAAVVWFASEQDPGPDPSRTKVLIFVNDDGRWKIDKIIERVAACDALVEVASIVGPPPGVLIESWPKSCE